MDFSSINWLGVVLAVLASMVIGSFWFNPKTFFPMWWKAIGKEGLDASQNSMPMGLVWGLLVLAAFVQAVFISLMVHVMGNVSLVSGATAGFFLWLGFVAPSSLTNKLFADRLKAWALEAGNHLITFVVMGAIIGALG